MDFFEALWTVMQRSVRSWSALERSSNVLDAHGAFWRRSWNALEAHGAFRSRSWSALEAFVERSGGARGAPWARSWNAHGPLWRYSWNALEALVERSLEALTERSETAWPALDTLDLLRDAPGDLGAAPGSFAQSQEILLI